MASFLGLRSTVDWATDQRPLSWREGILKLFPNGDAPLTAMTALMKKERVTDPEYNWWTKSLERQGGAVTNVFTGPGITNAYTSGGVAGTTLFAQMAEAVADHLRPGHIVLLRDSANLNVDVTARVTAIVKNGDNSYAAVKLLEADDNGGSDYLDSCNTILVVGNANSEGGERPESLHYNPTKNTNKCQIFRNALDLSRTALETKLRTGDAYTEEKRETLQYHAIEMEKAFIRGVQSETVGANGKKIRTTDGLVTMIRNGASDNVEDYPAASGYSGKAWTAADGGWLWLQIALERVFRYGSSEKMAFIGSTGLLGLSRIAQTIGHINITPQTTEFGMDIHKLLTPFGTLMLKNHPLFSNEATDRGICLIFEPKNVRYRYVTDTMFKKDDNMTKGGNAGIDGRQEEYLTEGGLEYHHPETASLLTGLNTDHA